MLVTRQRCMREGMYAKVGADAVDGASTLVYILGIGFMIYVGLEFVLPALFGATAKTKSAYHKLRSESRAEPRVEAGPRGYQSQFYGNPGVNPSVASF